MAAGIAVALILATLAMVFLTFRSGLALHKKLLAWCTIAALAYFYYPGLAQTYHQLAGGQYKASLKELVALIQVALPVVALVLCWSAFLVSSPMDSGRILLLFFVIFLASTAIHIATLI
jgi:uncharacterized membrane protein required for colicin V production